MAAVLENEAGIEGGFRCAEPPEAAATALVARAVVPGSIGAALARSGRLEVSVASSADMVEQALRLRHRVFVDELGAGCADREGIERDIYDPYCRHVVVRDQANGTVVGTCRLLMPESARLLGCLYSDREFWLTRLNPIRDSIVELGRACVDPAHLGGPTMLLLWSGIGALLAGCGHAYLIGCVSVSLRDGGELASAVYRELARAHLAEESLRVWPRKRLALSDFTPPGVALPPLIRAYLRAGAKLLGEPHRDDDFACADFPMLLEIDALGTNHRRRLPR